jgi:hypothetical protein
LTESDKIAGTFNQASDKALCGITGSQSNRKNGITSGQEEKADRKKS